MVAGLQHNL